MKRLNLFMIAAFVAASAMLVSCESDTDPPTITVNLNGTNQNTISVAANQTVTMNIDWEADEGTRLSDIRLSEVGGTNVEGFPVTRGFAPTNNLHRLTGFVVSSPHPTDGGVVTFRTEVTDNNNNSRNVDIVITFTSTSAVVPPPPDRPGAGETALGTAVNFEFVFIGMNNTGNVNPPASVGLRWRSNTATAANFEVTGTNAGIVILENQAAHDAITTREALIQAYIDGTRVAAVTWNFNGFQPRFFITRSGDNYSLVRMNTLTTAPGNSRATIVYRQ